jgi:hypothetical protein
LVASIRFLLLALHVNMMYFFILLMITVLLVGQSAAFLPRSSPSSKAKLALEDEAVAVYAKIFPFGREPSKDSPLLGFGMPTSFATRSKQYKSKGKRLMDISEMDARAAFQELSKAYGEQNALAMIKAQPICLSFDRKNFAATSKEYAQIFGEEEAIAMVCRNPGLIAVRPAEAAKATNQTMLASYAVAATRPLGSVLLVLLLALVMVPAIEGFTGISISIAKH